MSAVVQLIAVGDSELEAVEAFGPAMISYLAALRLLDDYCDDDAMCERILSWLRQVPLERR